MRPDLFGPGLHWTTLALIGLLSSIVGCIMMFLWAGSRRSVRPEPDESFQTLWRRYQQGDLTRQEFEYLKPARAMFQPPAPHQRLR